MSKKPKVLLLDASGRISKTLIVVLTTLSLLGFQVGPLTSHAQQTGLVLLRCDSLFDCNLKLDGKTFAVIPAGKLKKVTWGLGEHILEVSVADNRFSTSVTEKIITVIPPQTVVKLRPYILFEDLFYSIKEGTVVTKTLRTEVRMVKANGSLFMFDIKEAAKKESWVEAGFSILGDSVFIPSGASVKILGKGCYGAVAICKVRAQYNNKEFTIFMDKLVFFDKKTNLDLGPLVRFRGEREKVISSFQKN